LVEPDRAYHFTRDEAELANAVDERLYGIAGSLGTVVANVPDAVRLRVVLTSDHGRLLGEAARSIPVPAGLRPHGRAAWGVRTDGRVPSAAAQIDGDLVWLHPGAFGLPPGMAYAVVLDDGAFVTADGKGGSERFPHGGLFPEEVLVPWVVLARDATVEPISGRLTGSGVTGQTGSLTLSLTNPNEFAVTLVALELGVAGVAGPVIVPLAGTVGAMGAHEATASVAPWPDVGRADSVVVQIRYRLPDGEERRHPVAADLTSNTLYRKDDILGGLL
jgi:hypothetical protein